MSQSESERIANAATATGCTLGACGCFGPLLALAVLFLLAVIVGAFQSVEGLIGLAIAVSIVGVVFWFFYNLQRKN